MNRAERRGSNVSKAWTDAYATLTIAEAQAYQEAADRLRRVAWQYHDFLHGACSDAGCVLKDAIKEFDRARKAVDG